MGPLYLERKDIAIDWDEGLSCVFHEFRKKQAEKRDLLIPLCSSGGEF
jgi:hypothetical protein